MSLTLNFDGKKIEDPDEKAIALVFESLKEGRGFLGPGISMIILAREEAEELMASGTRDEGFILTYQDGHTEYNYNTNISQPIPLTETVRIFQSYARGKDWGHSRFKWERFELEDKMSNIVKRVLIIGFFSFLAYLLIKQFIAK